MAQHEKVPSPASRLSRSHPAAVLFLYNLHVYFHIFYHFSPFFPPLSWRQCSWVLLAYDKCVPTEIFVSFLILYLNYTHRIIDPCLAMCIDWRKRHNNTTTPQTNRWIIYYTRTTTNNVKHDRIKWLINNSNEDEEDVQGIILPFSTYVLDSLSLLHLFSLSLALSSYTSLMLILTFTHFVAF